MLVLSRHINEKILIPGFGITLQVVSIRGSVVRLGIEAPADVKIFREEIVPMSPAPTRQPGAADPCSV